MGVKIKTTFGRRIYKIATKLGISRLVTESVIKEYITSLIEDCVNGEDVVIDGFISVKIMKDKDGNLVSRGRVSDALKERLAEKNIKIDEE